MKVCGIQDLTVNLDRSRLVQLHRTDPSASDVAISFSSLLSISHKILPVLTLCRDHQRISIMMPVRETRMCFNVSHERGRSNPLGCRT
jgi:hypothetical protein